MLVYTCFPVTLPKTNIAMENPPFWWNLQGNMGIFMGYVSFREGTIRPEIDGQGVVFVDMSIWHEKKCGDQMGWNYMGVSKNRGKTPKMDDL